MGDLFLTTRYDVAVYVILLQETYQSILLYKSTFWAVVEERMFHIQDTYKKNPWPTVKNVDFR